MNVITSRENSLVKNTAKLKDKKYRTEQGLYLAEGARFVFDALKLAPQCVNRIILRESNAEEFESRLTPYEDLVSVISDELFNKLSDTENSQGILGVLRIPIISGKPQGEYILFLDKIRDPGNMGAIIRTACAAGFSDIVCLDCVDAYNTKVVRSCMTGLLFVNIYDANNFGDLKSCGYNLVAADIDGEDVFFQDFKLKLVDGKTKKICLVIGNEANGISAEVLSCCGQRIKIPMQKIESLNAAVSAGILMYLIKFKL